MKSARINLRYTSPSEDLDKCAGYNPDTSINVVFTLEKMRQMLAADLRVVEKLIEVRSQLVDLHPDGYDSIQVSGPVEVIDNLIAENILTNGAPPPEREFPENEQDTHHDRVRMLQNILADYDPVTRALAPIDELATAAQAEESDSYTEDESEEESDPEDVDLEEAMTQIAMMNSLRD